MARTPRLRSVPDRLFHRRPRRVRARPGTTVDGVEYPTRAGTVYFTNPGHVKAFAYDEPSEGWVLTFTEAFLKAHARADVFGDLPFLLAETAPPFYADAEPGGREAFADLVRLAGLVSAEASRASTVQAPLVGGAARRAAAFASARRSGTTTTRSRRATGARPSSPRSAATWRPGSARSSPARRRRRRRSPTSPRRRPSTRTTSRPW